MRQSNATPDTGRMSAERMYYVLPGSSMSLQDTVPGRDMVFGDAGKMQHQKHRIIRGTKPQKTTERRETP